MTPEYLRKVMVAAINQTWEGQMTPDVCTAIAMAAQAYADLYHLQELEKKIKLLEQQLVLQTRNVNA